MKRLALFISMGFALAAGAQTPAPADPSIPVAPTATTTTPAPATSQDAPVTDESRAASADRNCLKETGSRVRASADRKGRKCINAPGASYTREDLDKTGATNIKDALRRLDPTVH